jgi:hypothetical protein
MNKHSLGACSVGSTLDPKAVIEAQIDLVLHGLHTEKPFGGNRPRLLPVAPPPASEPSARMKRWLKWLLPVLALAVVGLFVGRCDRGPPRRQARATAVKPATGLDLAPNDVVVARLLDLPRTLDISGGLKAVKQRDRARQGRRRSQAADRARRRRGQGRPGTRPPRHRRSSTGRCARPTQTASSTSAQLEIAQRALENNRALVAQGFISPTALETSISTEAGARATLGSAQAAVELARKARADFGADRADRRPGRAAHGAAGRSGSRSMPS